MRVGLFTDQYYPSVSGVVTSIKMLYEGLEAMGHECFIFTSFDEDSVEDKSEINSKNVINFKGRTYPFKALKEFKFTFSHKKFTKIIKEYNLDIIHVHTEFNIANIARKAAKKLNIPLVHTLHTALKDYIRYLFPRLDKLMHPVLQWGLKKIYTEPISKAAVFDIVPTKKVLKDVHIYGMDRDVRVMPTGIDLNRFYSNNIDKDKMLELKNTLNISDEKFLFVYVGRTSAEKNIDVVIDGFAKAFPNNDKTILLIVGGGPELNDLKAQASKHEAKDRIIFTDLVPWTDVPLYYHMADVFVNASKSETQGLTYIEALASNLPVVVQQDECIDDVVIEGYNGYYFNSVDEMAEKLILILNNEDDLLKMKNNTFESIKKFSKAEYSKNILKLYEEAIEIFKNKKK